MKRYKYLVFLVLTVLVFVGCSVSGDFNGGINGKTGSGCITGTVVFQGTNQPVADAYVEIAGRSDRTNGDGFFHISNIPSGYHDLRVFHPGIQGGFYTRNVWIQKDDTITVSILVPRAAGIPSTAGSVGGYIYVPKGSQLSASNLAEVEPLFLAQASAPSGYEPLVGATIRLGNDVTRTERDGGFYLSEVRVGGPYLLTGEHDVLRFTIEKQNIYVYPSKTTWVGDVVGGVGYYLVIGIDTYSYEQKRLNGPVDDALAVFEELYLRNELAGYGELLITGNHKWKDGTPTKRQIEISIRKAIRLAENSESPDDYLVIYFSGNTGVDFLSPYDDNGKRDKKWIITDTELESWVREFPGNVTLIVDGPNSATMADGKEFRPFALRKDVNYTVLAGSKDGQDAYVHDRTGLSVFTHYLVEGLVTKKADKKGARGDITARELYDYTYAEMSKDNAGRPQDQRQLPHIHEGRYGDTVIFRY